MLEVGVTIIERLQDALAPFIPLFEALTRLGDEEAYLLILPALYWSVRRELGVRLGVLFLLSAAVNGAAKAAFGQPRPAAFDPDVRVYVDASGEGFPSGHAQNAVVLWGGLAVELRRRAVTVAAVLLAFGIGLSRVVLGVHFPTDVLGGWAIGLALLWLYHRSASAVEARVAALDPTVRIALVVLVAALVLVARPDADGARVSGAVLGLGLGLAAERRWLRFAADGGVLLRVARYLVGIVGLLAVWLGMRAVVGGSDTAPLLATVLRYGLVGAWIAAGGPWLFVALGLARREDAGPNR